MPEARPDVSSEDVSNRVARAAWGVLLIWAGAGLLLHWSWGVGLVGAGAILLAAQALRRVLRVRVEGFGLVAGLLLVVCGAWNMFDVTLNLVPLLFIGAGIALLVSIRTSRRTHGAPRGPPEAHAPSPPRA